MNPKYFLHLYKGKYKVDDFPPITFWTISQFWSTVQEERESLKETLCSLYNLSLIGISNEKMIYSSVTASLHNGVKAFLKKVSYFHKPLVLGDICEKFKLNVGKSQK